MSGKNCTSRSRRNQKYFDVTSVLDGVKQATFIEIASDGPEFRAHDMLLVDRARKPRSGDWVCWIDDDGGYHVHRTEDVAGEVYGVVIVVIRDYRKQPKRGSPAKQNRRIAELRNDLSRMERLPENEAERFRLETEIYKLENTTDEWPDMIAA